MSDAKSKIRKGVLFNRRLLSDHVYEGRNSRVIDNLLGFIAQSEVQSIHCFLPIKRNHEVDTWPLIEKLTQSGKSVVVSSTDFEKQIMSHFHYSVDLIFENDRFGIPTPASGRSANMSEVDAVLIPMLAGDKKGNRIGYGMGYYDRMLTEMSPDVLKIGITLGPLFDHFTFAEPHDVELDYCVTPDGVVNCAVS